ELLHPCQRFLARLVTFDIRMPILRGAHAELFVHSLRVPCVISKLNSIHPGSKELEKKNPRLLPRNVSAIVEIKTEQAISVESFNKNKQLGRLALRSNDFAAAAYSTDPSPCLEKHKAKLVLRVQVPCDAFRDECWAFIAISRHFIIFSVRGTQTQTQLIVEIIESMTAPKKEFPAGGSVQHYFYESLQAIWNAGFGTKLAELKKAYPKLKILFTGHSLGGAIASLASAQFAMENNRTIKANY
uniref:Fungal lipase-like domain-containing protein n=1 Tax=Meloidogyne javanica TaxID=6303 RepID=A0A915MWY3_MELJA